MPTHADIALENSKKKVLEFSQKYPNLEEGISVLRSGIVEYVKGQYHNQDHYLIADMLHLADQETLTNGEVIMRSSRTQLGSLCSDKVALLLPELLKEPRDLTLVKIAADIHFKGTAGNADLNKALELFQIVADQGDPYAQTCVGKCYTGMGGIEADNVKAAKNFQLAADQGFSDGNYYLGLCYKNGNGVEINDVEAVRNLQLAVDKGYIGAERDFEDYRVSGCSHLISSSIAGNVESVDKCLAKGADINKQWKGTTPLTFAVEYGHEKLVNKMIIAVASLQKNSHPGWRASESAQNNGADWLEFQSGLRDIKVQNLLSREAVIILDVILPESARDLKSSIKNNFDKRNADNPINEEDLAKISKLTETKNDIKQNALSLGKSVKKAEVSSIKGVSLHFRPEMEDRLSEMTDATRKISNYSKPNLNPPLVESSSSSIFTNVAAFAARSLSPSTKVSTKGKKSLAEPLLNSEERQDISSTRG